MDAVVWVCIAAFAFVGALVGLMFLPARIRLTVTGGGLEVELLGLDKIWTLRGRLVVPAAQIAAITVMPRSDVERPGIRLPGAYLPGVITAGSYGLGANRTFWDVRKADRVVVISCRPGSSYKQLILELPSPDAAAADLREKLGL